MGELTRQENNIRHRAERIAELKAKIDAAKNLLVNRRRFLVSVQKSADRALREINTLERRLGYEQTKLEDAKRQALHVQRNRIVVVDRKRTPNGAEIIRLKAASPKV